MTESNRILFIPSARRGNGTGHLKRCVNWSRRLPQQNFYIPDEPSVFPEDEIHRLTSSCGNRNIIRDNPGADWDLVIIDNRESDPASLPREIFGLPLVAVDEAGSLRHISPYVIDILPGLYSSERQPNRQGLSLMDLPELRESDKSGIEAEPRRILVSFGGEDPAGLTGLLLSSFSKASEIRETWTFVEGPSFRNPLTLPPETEGLSLLKSPENLKERLWEYDTVLCSFGLTAFEALASGRSVLLINPTGYHDRLSEKAGIPFIPKGWQKNPEVLQSLIRKEIQKKNFLKQNRILRDNPGLRRENFGDWLISFSPEVNRCPVCGSQSNRSLFRFENKSYFQCAESDCAMIYMLNFHKNEDQYGASYFFEDYQKQYGKTYLQDFHHIRNTGLLRLKQIKACGGKPGSLLDVGCAFGPFLDAALSEGYDCYGIDVSKEAVEHICLNLKNIRAEVSSFEDFNSAAVFGRETFQTVTLWYVIEHFRDLDRVLSGLGRLVEDGGVLAFSTPHGQGVSARMNRKDFFRRSPDDHYTVWDRKSARKVLKKYGFTKIRFVVTGYHPERIPLRLPFRVFLNRTLLFWFCRLFRLGDTFEIYALKKREKI